MLSTGQSSSCALGRTSGISPAITYSSIKERACRSRLSVPMDTVHKECAEAVLATLLVIGGVEQNPGPVDNIVQVLCSGCGKNLKSGTQCDLCGRLYHNSWEKVKFQVAESGKWYCDRCRSERLRVLEEKLKSKKEKQGAGEAVTTDGIWKECWKTGNGDGQAWR